MEKKSKLQREIIITRIEGILSRPYAAYIKYWVILYKYKKRIYYYSYNIDFVCKLQLESLIRLGYQFELESIPSVENFITSSIYSHLPIGGGRGDVFEIHVFEIRRNTTI